VVAGAPEFIFGWMSSSDALSRRTQMTRPNRVATNYTYDNLIWPTFDPPNWSADLLLDISLIRPDGK
jgi:hypothetical protein